MPLSAMPASNSENGRWCCEQQAKVGLSSATTESGNSSARVHDGNGVLFVYPVHKPIGHRKERAVDVSLEYIPFGRGLLRVRPRLTRKPASAPYADRESSDPLIYRTEGPRRLDQAACPRARKHASDPTKDQQMNSILKRTAALVAALAPAARRLHGEPHELQSEAGRRAAAECLDATYRFGAVEVPIRPVGSSPTRSRS